MVFASAGLGMAFPNDFIDLRLGILTYMIRLVLIVAVVVVLLLLLVLVLIVILVVVRFVHTSASSISELHVGLGAHHPAESSW